MERFRQISHITAREQGNLEILSDTSSCSSEDSFSYKLRSRSKRISEGPMKKLLAEELSKEMEPRRRPPSVIGRLMGLDTLPPQQTVKKQQKKFSESYLKKTASIGYSDKNMRSSPEGRSRRVRNREQQEFKDVYEVLESSVKQPELMIQERMKNSNETKMEFVRQKFMDVKRLSTDEKLHQSKEFHDALEVLDSNKDLLLRFLQEPDSLFTKHLHDLQGVPSPSQPGQISVLQPNAHRNLSRKSDKNIVQSDVASSFHRQEQGGVAHSRRKNVYIPSREPKSRVDEKDAARQLPTRIVVLKPKLKSDQSTARSLSSPDSSRGFSAGHRKNHKEFGSSESLELYQEIRQRRDSSFELEHMTHMTRDSREIAKEITRQMRQSVSSGSKMVPSSRLRGYAGDESSCSLSGNDSANESEEKTPTSRHFSDLKSRYSPSSSYSNESSVSREAKKRLSERWKMNHSFQEAGRVSRGSTLGEMLAMPDKEAKSSTPDFIVGSDGFSNRLSSNGGITRYGSPLGISSRDGWKDECVRSLPRSRSLPASSTCLNSPKASIRHSSLEKARCSIPKESVDWRPSNSKKVDLEQRDGFFSKSTTKSSRKKPSYSFCMDGEQNQPVQDTDLKSNERWRVGEEKSHPINEAPFELDEPRASFERVDLSEWRPSTVDIPVDDLAEATASVNDRDLSADYTNPESSPVGPTEGRSVFSHCTITEVESPASSKEAGQPSPVSVLEPPFVEECTLSSDSFEKVSADPFEKVSADLHGLRMQLQLLKLESSDAYSEGSEMIVSSDEDIREEIDGLPGDRKGMITDKLNRDITYVVDVLVDSGFHDADLDVLLETWYSPELPVAPFIFDKLEKKFGEQISWLRSDRKLLFDRINMGLRELLRPHMDPHPWVKLGKTIGIHWKGDHLAEELRKLLVRQNEELGKYTLEEALMKEMKLLELADDVDAVGNEIGRLLFDELVAEVVGGLVIT